MPPLRRLVAYAAVAAVVAGEVAAVIHRSWVFAQADAVVVLSTTSKTPFLAWAVRVFTEEPRALEALVAGTPTLLVRPGGGDGPWPALVFVNGATRRGRHHPTVERLARGLARAGFLVLVPDPPGLAGGEITERTLASTVGVARAAAARADARRGRVSLVGVSIGATLALLAAEQPGLAARVALVGGIAPYSRLVEVVRLATTGFHRERGRLVRYESRPFLSLVVARSLVAALPPRRDREALLAALRAVADDARDPLAVLREWRGAQLGPEARALVRVLSNRDPVRFDRLSAALSPRLRRGIVRLSPIVHAGRLRARVELASAPHDKYFPRDESRALVAAAPNAQLTVTRSLAHAVPEPSLRDVVDLFRLDGFIVRGLRRAGAG